MDQVGYYAESFLAACIAHVAKISPDGSREGLKRLCCTYNLADYLYGSRSFNTEKDDWSGTK